MSVAWSSQIQPFQASQLQLNLSQKSGMGAIIGFLTIHWVWFIIMKWWDTVTNSANAYQILGDVFTCVHKMLAVHWSPCGNCVCQSWRLLWIPPVLQGSQRGSQTHFQSPGPEHWSPLEFLTLFHVWLLAYPFYCNILAQVMPQSVKSILFHLLWLYRLLLPSTYLFAYTSLQSRGSNNSLLERENSIPLVQPCYHLLSYSILHTLILCH